MRPINYVKTSLFDSSLAQFKITVEGRFTRRRPTDNSLESFCYVDANGSATLNPSIYLVMAYRGSTREENKAVYMSYPQLYNLRKCIKETLDMLDNEKAYIQLENVMELSPEFSQPVVYANIGKEKKWISFKLAVMVGADGISREKAVSIQISGNDLTSVLSADEFRTVYTVIHDLDLASIQTQFGIMALYANDNIAAGSYGGGQSSYQQAPAAPYGGSYNNDYPRTPRYNNNGYQSSYQQGTQQTQRAPYTPRSSRQTVGNESSAPASYVQQAPQAPVTPASTVETHNNNNGLPPRSAAAPIVNMNAVDNTPVERSEWGSQTLDDIFDN